MAEAPASEILHHARITVCNQEVWRHDVIAAKVEDRYLKLECANHPTPIFYYLGGRTSVLLCATAADVTAALREGNPEKDWSGYCTCLSISRDPLCPVHGRLLS